MAGMLRIAPFAALLLALMLEGAACSNAPQPIFAVRLPDVAPQRNSAPCAADRGRALLHGGDPKVDVNRATESELHAATGWPQKLVEKVVRGRPYRSKRQLLQRGYLTPAQYQAASDKLVAHRAGP